MTSNYLSELDTPAERPELNLLRREIGWICHIVRIAAILYAAWILYLMVSFWMSADAIKTNYGPLLGLDLSGISGWQQAAAFGVDLMSWLFAAAACISAWQLFTAYLGGSILTATSARWLRRVALYGLTSQVLSIATRPLVSMILSLHLPTGQHQHTVQQFFQPNDLLTLLLLSGLLALGHIQKTAAKIASEHREFV